jgi:hypothetical protein
MPDSDLAGELPKCTIEITKALIDLIPNAHDYVSMIVNAAQIGGQEDLIGQILRRMLKELEKNKK